MPAVDVRYWHKADNPAASAFVRFWTTTHKGGFWREMVCPLMTQIEPTKNEEGPLRVALAAIPPTQQPRV